MSRNDFIRYNNQEWQQVTQTAPDYSQPLDLSMVEFEPTTESDFRELMFRKALGKGMGWADAREYADKKAAERVA